MVRLQTLQQATGHGTGRQGRRHFGQRGGCRQLRHVGTVSHPPVQVALGIQLVIGAHHGIARYPQCYRQVATGRQTHTTAQLRAENPLAQRLVKLLGQPTAAIQVNAGRVER
ncbi:hypothetical protein FQZ97_838950 [compost metagenome]